MTIEFSPRHGPDGQDREVAYLSRPAGGSRRLGPGWRENGVGALRAAPDRAWDSAAVRIPDLGRQDPSFAKVGQHGGLDALMELYTNARQPERQE